MARGGRIARVLAFCMVAAAACGGGADLAGTDGNSTRGPAPLVATYKLDRVNSKAIPIGDGTHIFINGVLELHADRTWCIELDSRGELGFSHVFGDRGTYSVNSSSLTFTSPAGEIPSFGGSIGAGGSVTVDYQFGNASDHFTFVQPPDDLTPHCS